MDIDWRNNLGIGQKAVTNSPKSNSNPIAYLRKLIGGLGGNQYAGRKTTVAEIMKATEVGTPDSRRIEFNME